MSTSCHMDFGCFKTFQLWHNLDVTRVAPTDENEPFRDYNLPTFDVFSSFHRLCKKIHYSINPSQTVILHALEYIKRLRKKAKYNDLGNTSGSKVLPPGSESTGFLTALMLANKFADDDRYTTKAWSQASGFSVGEINKMERECLIALDYRLSVSAHDLYQWSTSLKKFVEMHHPTEVPSIIIIPMVHTTEENMSKRRSSFTVTAVTSATSNSTTTSASPSITKTSRPAGFQSPPLGRIDNYPRSKPIEIKKQYTQTKWWASEEPTKSI